MVITIYPNNLFAVHVLRNQEISYLVNDFCKRQVGDKVSRGLALQWSTRKETLRNGQVLSIGPCQLYQATYICSLIWPTLTICR